MEREQGDLGKKHAEMLRRLIEIAENNVVPSESETQTGDVPSEVINDVDETQGTP